ncbi:MAG: M20/M25/M40 family metallo-hydrolase, partial [Chloroflexota bacterium]
MNTPVDPVALAADLIRIPSCDPPGGELAVAQAVASTLASIGIHPTLDEFLPGRANVLARIPGRGEKPPLVLSAHLDTVPTGDRPWAFDPFVGDVVDGRLRGRGASDMKSALACFVAAAQRIHHRESPLAGDLILAFTAGESANCLGARRLVEQGFQREIGAFLCGEPSTLDLIVVEKAILWLEAEAIGSMGHVSGDAGINAINLMVDFLADLRHFRLDLPAPGPTPHSPDQESPCRSKPSASRSQCSIGQSPSSSRTSS